LARGAVHHAARTAAGAALLLVVGSAVAENGWRSTLGVNSALNFTDNVFLSQVDPESDVVLEFQPYFNSTWQGRISSAQVAYGPQFVAYANNVELDRTWQYLRATGTTEVVEDFFSLTAWAQANPTVIDQGTGSAGFDTVGNPDAYTQTASFAIVPTFTFPFIRAGDFATVTFSPGINLALSGDTAGNTETAASIGTSTSLTVASGSYFYRMPWSLNYSSNFFDVEDGSGFSQVWGQVGYRFDARYRVDLLLGYDSQNVGDNFSDSEGRDLGDGLRWQPRFTWTPNAETSATVGAGQASYGNDYYLNVVRKQKRFALGLTYASTIENSRQVILREQVIPFEDAFGNPIFDPIAGGQINQVVNTPTLIDETYVNDNLSAVVAFQGRRTTVSFNASVNWDRYQFSDVETVQSLGSVALDHRLSSKMSGRAVLLYQTYTQKPAADADYDQYRLELGLSYRLGRKTTAGLAYYMSQSSAQGGQATGVGGSDFASTTATQTGNWDENRIVLTFSTAL
jgi:uncharacterized protein (PEP-CTERM system associated)